MTRFLVLLTEEDHFDRWDASSEADRDRDFAAFREFLAAVGDHITTVPPNIDQTVATAIQ